MLWTGSFLQWIEAALDRLSLTSLIASEPRPLVISNVVSTDESGAGPYGCFSPGARASWAVIALVL
jgi:hypothetical protein